MSTSIPPVGGPQPARDTGAADDADQTGNAEEGQPATAKEAPGAIGSLPKRTPRATGAQDSDRRYGFKSPAPTIDAATRPPEEPREEEAQDAPQVPSRALRDLRPAFNRTPPESPAEDATTSDEAQG